MGMCKIKSLNSNGVNTEFAVSEVFYLPKLHLNVLFIVDLTTKGYEFKFKENKLFIKLNHIEVAIAKRDKLSYTIISSFTTNERNLHDEIIEIYHDAQEEIEDEQRTNSADQTSLCYQEPEGEGLNDSERFITTSDSDDSNRSTQQFRRIPQLKHSKSLFHRIYKQVHGHTLFNHFEWNFIKQEDILLV